MYYVDSTKTFQRVKDSYDDFMSLTDWYNVENKWESYNKNKDALFHNCTCKGQSNFTL